jgi:indolepyruvate ferredoxin oxidoreductase
VSGHARKMTFGPWMRTAFRLLAKARPLRGTWLDPFAHAKERRDERALLALYEGALEKMRDRLSPETYDACMSLSALPEQVRGYGHVKAPKMQFMLQEMQRLQGEIENSVLHQRIAAE